ncbi:hypothetical protein FE633_13295 [Streptomyces montanus]|uniref:Uncharacterized protein n=2 Tax=Streptomyces montanus TaxID=2580423 RepID=A0A5R9FUX3_9ACTN|nr:hypothetical protein FE633_13295 [Streptomyces montanus]
MPDELLGALQYAERHQAKITDVTAARKAALTRVLLWEHLREQTIAQVDRHQARAVDAAREAGAEWAELVRPLAVGAPSGAYNKAKRLRAADLTDSTGRPVRRTPEAVDAVLAYQAEQARAAVRRQAAEERRRHLVLRVARELLTHRAELAADEECEYWLGEAETVLADCRTPTQLVSLATYLEAAVRHIQRHEQHTGQPIPVSEAAAAAYAAARALTANDSGE